MTASLPAERDNFYVITGSSAAGLTGLTFVVIALSADAKRANMRGRRASHESRATSFRSTRIGSGMSYCRRPLTALFSSWHL